jgi:tetratricopeptide (TPR) repeat protein
MLKKIPVFLFVSLLLNVSAVIAEYPETDRDFSVLPPFCKAKLKPSSATETELWGKQLGHDFGHTHHYCAALHSLNLANNILATSEDNKQEKRHLLSRVIDETKYMEEHASPNYVLFPNIYTTKAEALFALNQPAEATGYLMKAIAANKKFTKAYGMLAGYYIKIGDKKSANEILQEGLKYSPKSKTLQKKIKALAK